MKNSIKLTALFLLASVSVFAGPPSIIKRSAISSKNAITFSSLPSHNGVGIKVDRTEPGKAIVMVYDQDGNVILKDGLSTNKTMEKGYILNQLDNGNYNIEVTSNNLTVKKAVHVYDEDGTKEFIVQQ